MGKRGSAAIVRDDLPKAADDPQNERGVRRCQGGAGSFLAYRLACRFSVPVDEDTSWEPGADDAVPTPLH